MNYIAHLNSSVRIERFGPATLLHGDCRIVAPTLTRPDGILTDPPYGMNWNTACNRFSGGSQETQNKRRNGGRDWGAPIIGDDAPFDPSFWLPLANRVCFWGSNHFSSRLPVGTTLVWIKRLEPAYGKFLSDAELGWMNKGHGIYCRRDTSMKGQTRTRLHPNQKPVGIMEWCLDRMRLTQGQTVLDPYMGSASTGIACLQKGLQFVGIELDPTYFDTACRRIESAVRALEREDFSVLSVEQEPAAAAPAASE